MDSLQNAVFCLRIRHVVFGSTKTNIRVILHVFASRGTDLFYSEVYFEGNQHGKEIIAFTVENPAKIVDTFPQILR